MKMKSGWRLAVTLPGDLPEGVFRERVRIVARPSAATSTEAVEREIPLEGKVLRRVAVYGDDIDIYGTIDAGAIDSRDGYERTFLLKVTDEEPKLRVARIETVPAFVEVRVDPYGVGDATDVRGPTDDDTAPARAAGLYRLHVRIPPRNVPAAYQGDNRGKISISFDHPRIKPLELGLDFVVLKSN
jgi:hypothetical protein